MNLIHLLVLVTLALSCVLSFSMSALSWRRGRANGLLPFSLMMAMVGLWSLGYLFELVVSTLPAKEFWVNVQYIGIALTPPFWLLFAIQYAGYDDRRLNLPSRIILFGLPAATILFSWTNPLHGWMRTDIHLLSDGPVSEMGKTWGFWFWIQVSYSYLVLLAGTLLLIRGSMSTHRIYRSQRRLMVLAVALPWAGNFLYITRTIRSFDLSPLALCLTGAIILWGVLRWRLIDLVPVARESVIESLEDGVVVLADQRWVVDANPPAARILSQRLEELPGRTVEEIFSIWPRLCAMLVSEQLSAEFKEELGGRWYDLRVEPVHGLGGGVIGRMVVLRDVTALHQAESGLRLLNEDLEKRVKLRTAELTEELENRRRTEAALAASEERYALAARGANDGLWDWDIRSGSVFYSARWSELFGLSDGEMVGTIEEWLGRVHPDDAHRVRRELWDHQKGESEVFRSEHRILTPRGEELWLLARGQAIFDRARTPLRMAGSVTDISPQKKAESQLVYNAMHDLLTGLPNRALFLDRLAQAIERARRHSDFHFGVLYLDFDRFKVINDSLGHNIGDQLLIASARRLENAVRGIDTVARLGGDEFVILLDDVQTVEDAVLVAERVQHDLNQIYQLGGYQVYNSVSTGIVISQMEYERPDEVLRDADIAMYHAKLAGRARYSVFDVTMRERTRTRLEIENDLRGALEREEFSLHYQPLIQLDSGVLYGFEALLRWNLPERGEIEPAEFIPVAEETGLILPIGRWVLREASRQMGVWRSKFPQAAGLTMSVNVSARQLSQSSFADDAAGALREAGIPASALRLELTESALLEENEVVREVLDRLREMGINLHLDDFGTGYSSLSYLYRYRVDALKIDRSFITHLNPNDGSGEIVRTILALARELNLAVVAEGVETPDQLEALQDLQCELGQGFWIARPVDAAATEEILRGYTAGTAL